MKQQDYVMYGGAFNPPHHDHTGIVATLLEKVAKKVIIIPTGKRDDKHYSSVSDTFRENMIRLATEDFGDRVIIDTTFLYGDILTTSLNQAQYLQDKYRKEIPHVFGSDVAPQMMSWDPTGYVAHELPKVFISRPGYPIPVGTVSRYSELEYISGGFSSTRVREEVQRILGGEGERRDVLQAMVNSRVCDFILQNRLFCSV